MITSELCYKKYGNPYKVNNMAIWEVPFELHFKPLPLEIYCNKDLIIPLENSLKEIIRLNLQSQIKTWDGCFCIRTKRKSKSLSLHSWGVAFDINAIWNKMGKSPTMSQELVNCFTGNGFDWGGNWKTPDGMHFQLSKI